MPCVYLLLLLLPTSIACEWKKHANTIGPKLEQAKHVSVDCKNSSSCVAEAAEACDASSNCNSFGISPNWHDGHKAQVISAVRVAYNERAKSI